MKMQILLSTYNGELYLREQLDSFIALDNYDEIKVLIRDDGSTDGTVEVLREYEEKYGFEVIVGENIGLADSMFELMRQCDMQCEYFSFADQDDVWLPNKLQRAAEALDKEDNSIPLLYAACSSLTDVELNVFGQTAAPKRPTSFYNAMIQNVCPGHTQVCNRALMEIARGRYSGKIFMIDYWFYMAATAVGKVLFDCECTTLYRQHGKNTLGYETNFFKKNVQRLKRLFKHEALMNIIQLNDLRYIYSDLLDDAYKRELDLFFGMQDSFFHRFMYIFKTKAYRQVGYENLMFRLMYLFGKYNIE